MTMTQEQREQATLLFRALRVLLDAVKAGGELGAPAGVMYSALMGAITLERFNGLMTLLVRNGNVRKDGDVYHFLKDI